MTTKTKKVSKAKKEKFDFRSIKNFEDACKKEGVESNNLPDVSMLPEHCRKAIIAYYKLVIIFRAINNGWTPDWGNFDQWKYYVWFGVLSSGFGFSGSAYDCTIAFATVGSRLCTDSGEKALYIAEQFKAEYQDYLLYSE